MQPAREPQGAVAPSPEEIAKRQGKFLDDMASAEIFRYFRFVTVNDLGDAAELSAAILPSLGCYWKRHVQVQIAVLQAEALGAAGYTMSVRWPSFEGLVV